MNRIPYLFPRSAYSTCRGTRDVRCAAAGRLLFGLYTILPSPMLYGVWHTKGGSVGGAYIAQWACNSIAIGYDLQVGEGNHRMIDSHNEALK